MSHPNYNPPNDDCPECKEPSKTYFMGGSTKDGVATFRWECHEKHEWVITEVR